MMREILFRGKRIDNGEWVFGDLSQYTGPEPDTIEICFPIRVEDEDCNLHDDFDYVQVDPATVGQYTGLKDADGKRIFEGDIIVQYTPPIRRWPEQYGNRYCVDMDEGRRGWWPFACGDGCGCCEKDTISPDGCKVLGNIHDNPELMEVRHE